MHLVFEEFLDSLISGIQYIPSTMQLVLIPIIIGTVAGTLIALVRFDSLPVLSQVFAVFVNIYLGVPLAAALLVYQLLFLTQFDKVNSFLHLGLRAKDVSIIWVGIFALTLQAACMISETVRGALASVDPGQWEAGYCVGMTKWQTIRRIIMPQMISEAIPNMISLVIGLFKNSSICMSIGVTEITFGVGVPAQITYSYLEAYAAAAVIYWVITIAIEFGGRKLEDHIKQYRSAAI